MRMDFWQKINLDSLAKNQYEEKMWPTQFLIIFYQTNTYVNDKYYHFYSKEFELIKFIRQIMVCKVYFTRICFNQWSMILLARIRRSWGWNCDYVIKKFFSVGQTVYIWVNLYTGQIVTVSTRSQRTSENINNLRPIVLYIPLTNIFYRKKSL